jgi:Carboxypeptidase regulatory-like domain
MFTNSLRTALAGLMISAVTAWAAQPVGPARLEGDVKDSKGQPVAGAEVHLKGADGSGERIVRTDQNGHYGIGKLPVTDYEVVLFVNGTIKASLNSMKVFSDKATFQNFKLTGQYAANKPAKKHTHMVYVPAETGSNLSGHWVEVDDTLGVAAAQSGEVKHLSGEAARSFQRNTGTTGGGN